MGLKKTPADTKLSKIFALLGMHKHAAAVYVAIRESSPILAASIAAKIRIYRPAVYRALSELLNAGFISKKKIGGRTYYVPENAQRIIGAFTHGLEGIAQSVDALEVGDMRMAGSSLRILSGFGGVRQTFDDVIEHTKARDTFYRYTSERNLGAVNRYLSPHYRARRDKKRLERLVISNPTSGSQKRPRLERFIKYIPKDANLFEQNIIQIVYGDRVAFIDLNKEEAVIIENAALADFQKVIFAQLYKRL
jgi:predicted transcriptional regulator